MVDLPDPREYRLFSYASLFFTEVLLWFTISDKLFPAFGFGAKIPQTNQVSCSWILRLDQLVVLTLLTCTNTPLPPSLPPHRENLPDSKYKTPKTHCSVCDNPTNCTRWQFVANIISLTLIAQHVIDKKLVLSLTRLSFLSSQLGHRAFYCFFEVGGDGVGESVWKAAVEFRLQLFTCHQ